MRKALFALLLVGVLVIGVAASGCISDKTPTTSTQTTTSSPTQTPTPTQTVTTTVTTTATPTQTTTSSPTQTPTPTPDAQPPKISNVIADKLCDEGFLLVKANVTDDSGIDRVEIHVPSNVAKPNPMNYEGGNIYFYKIFFGEEPNSMMVKVCAYDKFNNSACATSDVNWEIKDAFGYYGTKNGFNLTKVFAFYDSYKQVVDKIYITADRPKLIPSLHVYDSNPDLLKRTYQHISRDSSVKNKEKIFVELNEALYDLELHQMSSSDIKDSSLLYLGNLANYLEKNPAKVFDKDSILRVVDLTQQYPIIYFGLSGKQPIVGEEALILTYVVNDNYEASQEYPYAAWAYAKQGHATLIWLNMNSFDEIFGEKPFVQEFNYTTPLEFNGTKVSLRDVLNKDFQLQYKYAKEGKLLVGLNPEDVLKLVPSDAKNRSEVADFHMRQKALPQALFLIALEPYYTDAQKYNFTGFKGSEVSAKYIWEKYPGVMDPGTVNNNGVAQPLIPVFHPEIALYQAYKNLELSDRIYKNLMQVINNPDTPLVYDWSAKKWAIWLANLRPWFPNTTDEAQKDVALILEKGTKVNKAICLGYALAVSDRVLGEGTKEEVRVETTIAYLHTLGIPVYRIEIAYPMNSDRARALDGQPSLLATPEDISLLYSRSSDKLAISEHTYSIHYVGTRLPALTKDGSPFGKIFLPDFSYPYYYKNE